MTTLDTANVVDPPRHTFCRFRHVRGCIPARNGKPFPRATNCRSRRLSSVLWTSEGQPLPGFAHDWQASLPAGARRPSTEHCRVRDIFRNFDPSSRGCSEGQRWWTPHRHRIRALQDIAGARKSCCRRFVRFGGSSRRRCAGNTCPRSAQFDRFCSARRCEEISIRPYYRCLRAACAPVHLLLPTMRMRARSILPAFVPPLSAISRSLLPTMSNCR